MSNFLLEIGLEEVPARFLNQLLSDVKENFSKELVNNNLKFTEIKTFATYRRLAIQIQSITAASQESEKEVKGPPLNLIFAVNGEIQPAGLGFLKKINTDLGQSFTSAELKSNTWLDYAQGQIKFATKIENSTTYITAIIKEKAKSIEEILKNIVPKVILSINLPIAMRWGKVETPFIRPVHWFCALLDEKIIEFELFGIKSGNFTFGHRFLTKNDHLDLIAHGKEIKLEKAEDYQEILRQNFVFVDQEERKEIISKFVKEHEDCYYEKVDPEKIPSHEVICNTENGPQKHIISSIDENLLAEVTNLVEYPQKLIGQFDVSFLEIPQDVLIECMKKHQKFFPITYQGKLANQFIVIADNLREDNQANVRKGNEAVLLARLEDAKFFWEEDRKKPLAEFNEKLKAMVFQKNVGTLFDKTERLQEISSYLCDKLSWQSDLETARKVAELCKSDLTSHLVFELPNLQGVAGGLLAQDQGLGSEVATGIAEHYLPIAAGGLLPVTRAGLVVSLADKMDTLVCSFYNGFVPKGSKDIWGLKRAATGGIRIILETNNLDLDLTKLIDFAYDLLPVKSDASKAEKDQLALEEFFKQRFKNWFLEQDKTLYDLVDAVLSYSLNLPKRADDMVAALVDLKNRDFENYKLIAETAVRVKRLAAKAVSSVELNPNLFDQEIEKTAFASYEKVNSEITGLLRENNAELAMAALMPLANLVSQYFVEVLVMCEDEAQKNNHLSFLRDLNDLFSQFADFEALVV